jgi:predicted ferric reductase
MGATLLSSIAVVRRHLYEIFLKLHQILAATIIAAIFIHSPSKHIFTSPIVYLFAAICLQIFIAIFQFGHVLYRNVRYRKPLNRAEVRTIIYKRRGEEGKGDVPLSDAFHVHIQLSRSWNHRAGEYVYLCIPGASRTSFMQSHPFYVSWWYRDAGGNDFVVLIVQKRAGFTKHLQGHAKSEREEPSKMRAIIEGPYGNVLDLKSYGTVLLFATGIGIAGQLPYVTRLLEGYHNCEVKTRRIALFWEVDSQCKASIPLLENDPLILGQSTNGMGR